MANQKITRELSIFINDREVVNSLGGITREITKVNGEIRNLNKNSVTYNDDLKKLQTQLGALKNSQQEFKDEISETTVEAGAAREALTKMFAGLAAGDMRMAKEGLDGISGSVKGLVKSSLAFIATPIGAAIAVLSGLVIAAKYVYDFNSGIEKSSRLIENLSGKTGQVVEDIRVKIQSLTDVFEVEFNAIANAVDNLVDTGAAKDELEALELIKNGLLTAPDKNEFISSLESTAVIAKTVGLDLETVIALKKQIETTGVNPEATFGALEKGAKNLLIQTKVLRDQMTATFGAAFTDEILAKVKTGQISTVEALDQINKKSKEVGLNQTQQAQLGAQLFGKSALAAGGYATILDTVTGGLKKQKEELNENQQAVEGLIASQERLNKAESDLFKTAGFGSAIDMIKAKWNDMFTIIYSTISLTKTVFQVTKNQVTNFFIDAYNVVVGMFGKLVSTVAPALELVGVDVDKLRAKLNGLKAEPVKLKFETETVNTTTTGGKKTGGTPAELAAELAEQQKVRDEAAAKESEKRKAAAEKKKAEEEKARKEYEEALLAVAAAKARLAKAELDAFIADHRSKLDSEKSLTPELIAEETKRLDEIKFRRQNALAEQRLSDIAEAEKSSKSAEELQFRKQAIDVEYLTAEQNLALEFYKSTDELKKQYDEEQKVLKAEQLAADNELALMEAATKAEEDRLKQEQDYQEDLDRYKKMHQDKKITDEEYQRFKDAAKNKQDQMDRERELQQVQGTLGGLSAVAGAIGEMFGQSKELAIVQAGINGAMAVTSILAQYPKFDGGFAMWAAIAAAGITTISQIGKIAKAKPPKEPKFYYGGFTGSSASMGYDEHGPVTGVVHAREWVAPESMTQSPRYAGTIAWLENERQRNLRQFATGGETTPGTLPPNSQQQSDESLAVMKAVLFRLENPVAPNLLIGYQHAEDIDKLNKESASSKQNGIVS